MEDALSGAALILGTGRLHDLTPALRGRLVLGNTGGVGHVAVRLSVTRPGVQNAQTVRASETGSYSRRGKHDRYAMIIVHT